jgi:hypothetical protein
MKFNIGDEVCRREAPHKTGVICEIDEATCRYRVKWSKNRTWNQEKFSVKVG